MEHESLDYKIVMDDGPDTEVLGCLATLDIASAAYMHAIVKYPLRNLQLRQGAHIIKRHDGEPRPEPPKDPNLPSHQREPRPQKPLHDFATAASCFSAGAHK